MESFVYHVDADWDAEAEVWVATSEDVPGLATEAPTVEALSEKLRTMIPELLEANGLLPGGQPNAITFELTSHGQEKGGTWPGQPEAVVAFKATVATHDKRG